MKPTKYTQDNVRVYGPTGQFITLTKVSVEIPDVITMKNGTRSRVTVDVGSTISIKTETLIGLLAPMALAGGSWADILPLDFINLDITPDGQVPFVVTLENCVPLIKIPSMDKLAGGEMIFDLPVKVGECYVMGVSVNREPSQRGI